jgi:hypothetical protein
MAIVKGKCTEIYPHMRLRVKPVFEVVRATDLQTAYADKHPAYGLVRDPTERDFLRATFPSELPHPLPSIE